MTLQKQSGMSEPAKKTKKTKRILIPILCILLFALAVAGGWFYIDSLAYKIVRVEAGIPVAAPDFMKKMDENAFFTQKSQPIDITEPGEYLIQVKSGLFTHKCILIIEDTIAPQAEPVPVKMEMGETCEAEAFVTDVVDATPVAVTYEMEPNFGQSGSQTVRILLTDRGGNRTVLESELFLIQLAESVTVEAGGEAPNLDSFVIVAKNAAFLTKVKDIDYTKVGDYEIRLDIDGTVHTSILHVADTVPPRLEVQDIEGYTLFPRTVEEFVTEVEDVTEVTLAFREEPDWSVIGPQEVEIAATDEGGNETVKKALLILQADTEAPVIRGAVDLTFFIGESISYRKNVSVTDNCDECVTLNVDTSHVNLAVEGTYPVTYTAKDFAGNTASVTVNLTVRKRVYSVEEIYAAADDVLVNIITPDMSERDKVWAIYSYVMGHIGYISHSEKGDWINAAYEGLILGKGDCYVYASTTKALLIRAGITNMDIRKIPAKTEHYWNLVDIGDGWLHLDTTPRKDHPVIFLWTNEELMNYSAIHNKSHNYDPSQYPDIS